MKPLSIQFRLTAWYFVALVVTLAVFGTAAFLAMHKGIERTVDQDLRSQSTGIQELMRHVLSEEPEELRRELREHSEIRAEADFSQVFDGQGHWIYRSPLMVRYALPQRATASSSVYGVVVKGLALRVLVSETVLEGNTYEIQVAARMNAFYAALNQFKWLIIGLSPFLLILASAGGYWMSRRALSPVDEIISAAQKINSKNLSRRLKVSQSGDELQRLAETLNGMLERLEAAFNRITRFTADASHELRTPLALMRTTTEVSLRTSTNVAEYRDVQLQTLDELEKMSGLVEKLMLLTRADAGVETLRRLPVDLAGGLREACKQGRTLTEAKNMTLKEVIPEKSIMVEGDRDALHRLYLILIDNAVKYSPPGGQIFISLTPNNGFAVIEVRDTGIGIAPEDLPHIFDRFYRADKARSRQSGGIGLGLSIARWEAEAHGGSIEVQSTLGKGSVFSIRLPLMKP